MKVKAKKAESVTLKSAMKKLHEHAVKSSADGTRQTSGKQVDTLIDTLIASPKSPVIEVNFTDAEARKVKSLCGSNPHNADTHAEAEKIFARFGITRNSVCPLVAVFPSFHDERKEGNFAYLLNRLVSQMKSPVFDRSKGKLHSYTLLKI